MLLRKNRKRFGASAHKISAKRDGYRNYRRCKVTFKAHRSPLDFLREKQFCRNRIAMMAMIEAKMAIEAKLLTRSVILAISAERAGSALRH